MVDYVSLGKQVPEEKLRDCLDLMKIMVDEQFLYDVCTLDGQLSFSRYTCSPGLSMGIRNAQSSCTLKMDTAHACGREVCWIHAIMVWTVVIICDSIIFRYFSRTATGLYIWQRCL